MPHLAQVTTLSSAEKRWLTSVRDIVLRYAPDAKLILYGSAARGTRTAESDYDVVILTSRSLRPKIQEELRGAIYEVELQCNVVLSVLFLTHADWDRLRSLQHPFWKNITQDGIEIE
ncbi:MAG: nucleotidyltransferase domain-containing protein [bacterium]|nr:nucleotidyltransferase domain-containing protein [bacterium]MCS7309557.1 nucleotidyltransferase domain-containing protein [Armatimonadota bacterium]